MGFFSNQPTKRDEPLGQKRHAFGSLFNFSFLGFGSSREQEGTTIASNNTILNRDNHIQEAFERSRKNLVQPTERAKEQIRDRRKSLHKNSYKNSQLNILQSYYDSLKQENDLLEQRLSGFYGKNGEKKTKIENHITTEIHELDDSLSNIGTEENQLARVSTPKEINSDAAEVDFGGYYDAGGNLVRPPLIVLDPKERYQLYQLKEQMKIHDFWKASTRYMVDPKETVSTLSSRNPKLVDTTTQTVDHISFLRTQIFHTYKRKKIDESRRNKSGYFVGEFVYDLEEERPERIKASKPLAGYLGYTSKPEFSKDKVSSKFAPPSTRFGIDEAFSGTPKKRLVIDKVEETEEKIIKIKDGSKVDAEHKNSSVGPSAGFNFSNKTIPTNEWSETNQIPGEKIGLKNEKPAENNSHTSLFANKASLFSSVSLNKDDSKLSSEQFSKQGAFKVPQVETSSSTADSNNNIVGDTSSKTNVFQFSSGISNSTDPTSVNEAKSTSLTNKEEKKTSPLFGSIASSNTSSESSATKRVFSFHSTSNDSSKGGNFAFGLNNKAQVSSTMSADPNDSKPAFSFGSFSKPINEKDNGKPATGDSQFSTTTEKKESSDNAIASKENLFGSTLNKSEESSKPFSLSTTGAPQPAVPSSTFSFGETRETQKKPAFAFNRIVTEKKDDNSPFSFTSGGEKTTAATQKPFTFGVSAANKEETSKPTFGFGSTNEKKQSPKISFSASTDTKSSETKPSLFGSTQSTGAPAPSFGISGVNKLLSSNTADTSSKPTFSFGQPLASSATSTAAPAAKKSAAFGFGSSIPASTSTIPTSSLFEQKNSATSAAVPFSFGNTNKNASESNTALGKGFSFGSFTAPVGVASPAPSTTFKFGSNTQVNQPSTTNNFSLIGQTTSTSNSRGQTPVFGAHSASNQASRSTTPAFNAAPAPAPAPIFNSSNSIFGNNQTIGQSINSPATSAFQFNNPQPAFGSAANIQVSNNAGGFNFSRSNSSTPAPVFQPSNTPNFNFSGNTPSDPSQVFGGVAPNLTPGSIPNSQNGTPIAGRKIAQMRRRRG